MLRKTLLVLMLISGGFFLGRYFSQHEPETTASKSSASVVPQNGNIPHSPSSSEQTINTETPKRQPQIKAYRPHTKAKFNKAKVMARMKKFQRLSPTAREEANKYNDKILIKEPVEQ